MGQSPRDRFIDERDRIEEIEDQDVQSALSQFADAMDPKFNHLQVPKPGDNGGIDRESKSNSTARIYLSNLRTAHQRDLDLLGADAETINTFIRDLVTEPAERRTDLVGPPGPKGKESISRPSAAGWQSALRAFYRFCSDPRAEDRPDVAVPWTAVDGSKGIKMFKQTSKPMHDEEDMPANDDLNAMREACLESQNTRRDRAFVEMAAGTGQRVTALVTLRIRDVRPSINGTNQHGFAHILLNPEIDGDGDKGAIEAAGRMCPYVADPEPVLKYIEKHPLQDPEVRAEHGAPEDFRDCYLFVGDPNQHSTNLGSNWGDDAARAMLNRRKADTETLHGVKTVDIPVNPHNWRHYAYTQSQDLPMDESTRRAVFGWRKGSDTGQRIYGHKENEKAVREFTEKWAETHGAADTEGVAEQIGDDSDALADYMVDAIQKLPDERLGDIIGVAIQNHPDLGGTITSAVERTVVQDPESAEGLGAPE